MTEPEGRPGTALTLKLQTATTRLGGGVPRGVF